MQAQEHILNYRLLRPLGDGGMGEVWLAQHTLLDRQVAIKSLHRSLINKPTVRQRFKNEAATLARLQHPHIVTLLDYLEDERGCYLIIEYVEGRDLSDYITDTMGPIPEPTLSALFGQILEGFAYAHRKNIVHRDIKPSNFIITGDHTIKVLDFGIAKMLDATDHALTKTGSRIGTVLYMSPEQVKGEPVDQRSDIYSLGVTLFQMATGQCPYDNHTTEFQVYSQIVNEDLPPAATFYPGVPENIDALIQKATAKDPEARFQNCDEFLAALRGEAPPAGDGKVVTLAAAPPTTETKAPLEATRIAEGPVAEGGDEGALVNYKEDSIAAETPTDSNPQRSRAPLFIAIGVVLILVIALAIQFSGSKKEDLFVIASSFSLRPEPSMNSKRKDNPSLAFGYFIDDYEEANPNWIRIEVNGIKGYVNRKFLTDRDEFLQLKHLADNQDGSRVIPGSFHKIALRDYFDRKGYDVDLPQEDFEKVYEKRKSNAGVWVVNGHPKKAVFQTGISRLKFSSSYFPDGYEPNSAVIITNKAYPEQRKLVIFDYDENKRGQVLATWDLSDYEGFNIRKLTQKDLKKYRSPNFYDRNEIQRIMEYGKEGINLGRTDDQTRYLILWDDGIKSFELQKTTNRYYGYGF
ncbi:MAG: serine/threonine-protein kinase [Bacteroidota bacterium]